MDALEKRKHHIVVIDMRLPVYSAGEQICKKIRSVCGLQNIVLLAVSPAMLVEIEIEIERERERESTSKILRVCERERGGGKQISERVQFSILQTTVVRGIISNALSRNGF